MTGGQYRQRPVKKSAQTGVKSRLKNEQLIHQARAEVLKMTADEQMTVGEGTATWVREIILQCETVDVSYSCSVGSDSIVCGAGHIVGRTVIQVWGVTVLCAVLGVLQGVQ
jgi:hypothetical protein